ncbi:hypothetical protein Sme01_33230 [Sphaerisporangium melleum]|uniref:DUF742 domain-containing protein n=1 Tax=Sphaerisporangium melleum TaxID=321316 RepID=A0A917QXH7_9ACTN|nr:DUF742 domain-containing protein [Sphaerisporangium melleum]GGK73903.1 hypothetical protein GCM10007964_15890 [Sphaerisporangium melleum]GII70847.1 hypothetical protein Sme01_33230 [Sphaerisporangium melleum]
MDEPEVIDDGPVVRPYALAKGRTPPPATVYDMLAHLEATGVPVHDPGELGPEHHHLLALGHTPRPLVEVAADLDLPLGVIRLLLHDLVIRGLARVHPPDPAAQNPKVAILQEVIKGLQAL